MRETILIKSTRREELIDITEEIRAILEQSSIQNGIMHVYALGATAAMMVQENWDDSVPLDVMNLLRKLIPPGVWLHDAEFLHQRCPCGLE